MSDEVDALKQQKIGVPKFNIYELKGILKKYAGYKEQTKDEFVKIEEIILNKNVEIIKEYGDIPEVKCYPNMLNQVFLNILMIRNSLERNQ